MNSKFYEEKSYIGFTKFFWLLSRNNDTPFWVFSDNIDRRDTFFIWCVHLVSVDYQTRRNVWLYHILLRSHTRYETFVTYVGIKEFRKNRMLHILLVVDTFVTNLREFREHKKDRPARRKRRRNRFFTRRHYCCANSHWIF